MRLTNVGGQQDKYVEEFRQVVLRFLAFHARYADVAWRLAEAVTRHTTPVGSGTVGRTQCIPIGAEAAVIAWMRHQATDYERMRPRGDRRYEVQVRLAEESRRLLDLYRAGTEVDASTCPLLRALARRSAG